MKTIESKLAGRSEVMIIEPEKDKKGYFYSICIYSQHRGIIQKPFRCKEINCEKYKKIYIQMFRGKRKFYKNRR